MRIAVIGGIGSGKSEVLKVARELGIPSISADEINSELLRTPEYVRKLETYFPQAVVCGVVDKPALSAEVFSDPHKRETLNALAHPEIVKRIDADTSDPLVVELPLALECGMRDLFDEIIFVSAPRALRIKRLEGRGVSRRRALAVMRVQAPAYALKKIATRTIDNSGTFEELRSAAREILTLLCK